MAPRQEVAIRAVGTALAGLALATAIHMLAYGGGRTPPTGGERVAILGELRGRTVEGSPVRPPAPALIDMAATGSLPAGAKPAPRSRPAEIVVARADRFQASVGGATNPAVVGDSAASVGRTAAIVARNGGPALLGDKGARLLAADKSAHGAGRKAALALARFGP